jgi:hypothetical protein
MNKSANESVFPAYFISHGDGPWVWMNEMKRIYENLEKSLRGAFITRIHFSAE